MSDYPCTTVPGKLGSLLAKIREVGVPTKASIKWLESIGFRSSNDRSLLKVLQHIGFADGSGIPTDGWTKYRGADYKRVLAAGIRTGYTELFDVYPDAWKRSSQELEHYFRTHTNSGKQVVAKTTSTFLKLSENASFDEAPELSSSEKRTSKTTLTPTAGLRADTPVAPPTAHINLQIHISPEASSDQIEQIFAAIAKHLYQ